MNGSSWRPLVPVIAAVLLAHVAMLFWLEPVKMLRAVRLDPARFATRTILPQAQAAPAPASEPAAVAAPPVAPKATAPAAPPVRREAVRAAAPPVATAPAGVAAPKPAPAARPADAAPAARAGTVTVPPSARYHYDVAVAAKGFSLRGKGELEWRHDGRQYEARLEISNPVLPSRVQRSNGRITGEGLAPAYFSDKSRNEQAAHFDRAKGVVIFSNNRPQADLVPGLQDRLSVLLQLSAMVAGQPARFPAGTEIAIPTASTRETETWLFEVEGEENLQLPGGAVRALKLHRKPRKEFDQRLELWLAPRMDYAPVRVRLTNPNGDAVDQRWASTDKG